MTGCSTGPQADIPTTADPREEASKLETDINMAVGKNVDVLAPDEFKQSRTYLHKAQKGIGNEKSQSYTLDALRSGRGHLNAATALAQTREGKAEGLMAARQMTLAAGAYTHADLIGDLKKLDDDVSEKAASLSDTSTEKLADFQQRYVDIEKRAVVLTELGQTQAMFNGAKKDDAEDKAPVSYKKAELSLKNAESMISTNVRNPSGYAASVAKAKKDAVQLLNVMSVIQQNGKNLKESVAIKMVSQNKVISGLNTDLDSVTAKSATDKADLQAKNANLSSDMAYQDKKLASANSKVQIQKILEQARTQFSADEAEAYQQGENLVVRLKQVNFASGRSDLPATSLPLLAKVSDVAKSINASQITVEGHTDSVGGATQNQKISEERASAVASYFKTSGLNDTKINSEGYGFKKPIATNKSKEGRAQNRRVDVIITPETAAN